MAIIDFEAVGHRIHPILASLPLSIGLLSVGYWGLLAYQSKRPDNSLRLLSTASFFLVLAAFLSGDFAADSASSCFEVAGDLIAIHEGWGKACLILWGVSATLIWLEKLAVTGRKGLFYSAFFCASAAVLLNVITASKGGDLVFKHGAGLHPASAICAKNPSRDSNP